MSMCAAFLCGCTNDKEEEPPTSDGKAEMLTFGFYQEDNSGLDGDYVVTAVEREMIIRLPEALFDNTTLKGSLVARFTVGENDAVYVGAVEQVSGQTANDYNYPVDFTVTDQIDNSSAQYTVRVGKILDTNWSEIATITGDNNAIDEDLFMRINPKDGMPYFFYTDEYELAGETTPRPSAVVSKWDGSQIVPVGTPGFSQRVSYPFDLQFDGNGNPYIFYIGYVDGSSGKTIVMNYNGASWSVVGKAGYSTLTVLSSFGGAMGVDPGNSQVFTVFSNNSRDGEVPRRAAVYSTFNGSAWTSDQLFSAAGDQLVANPKTITVGNDIYMLYAVQNNIAQDAPDLAKGYSLLKYSNGNWSKVVDNFCLSSAQSHYGNISLAADSQGNIYCAFFDSAESNWVMQLWKVEGSTFVKVGNSLNLTVDGNSSGLYSVAVDKDDVPQIIARNEADNSISIYKYDTRTSQWGDPFVACQNAGTDSPVQIAFNEDGVGYAVYISRDEVSDAYTYHILKGEQEADILPE